jgi:hypothetical protein
VAAVVAVAAATAGVVVALILVRLAIQVAAGLSRGHVQAGRTDSEEKLEVRPCGCW